GDSASPEHARPRNLAVREHPAAQTQARPKPTPRARPSSRLRESAASQSGRGPFGDRQRSRGVCSYTTFTRFRNFVDRQKCHYPLKSCQCAPPTIAAWLLCFTTASASSSSE